jgi:hypothetical protein
MTKYRLKDQELQKHLDAISGGAFSECLKVDLFFFEDGVTRINFGKKFGYASQFSVLILKDELEELPEYNPDDWNHYPEVTPPENTWMRVIQCTQGWTRFTAAFYRDGKWCQELEIGGQLFRKPILGVWKFRPWE